MESDDYVPVEAKDFYHARRMMSPEIVEIVEEHSISFTSSNPVVGADVYVAVGKDDIEVLKWALDHVVSPGATVFLIHVYPPITYIPTPVGKLSRSQLTQEQVRVYINEEENKRKNLLQKYISLCNDAKVRVDTVLLENDGTAKAILDLIPVLNITNLVMGVKKPPLSRIIRKKMAKGEFVKKSAPDFCQVSTVYVEKKVVDGQDLTEIVPSSGLSTPRRRSFERKPLLCNCFSGMSLTN
ncbi:hypothetical protein UlMin_007895 [Ulmus minor]